VSALLALVPIKDWVYVGVIVALLTAFGIYTVHERHEGEAHEIAALKKSSDALQAKEAAHVIAVAKAYADSANANEEKLNAQLQAAADQHNSDADRLREYDAYRRTHKDVGSPQTGSGTDGAGNQSTSGYEDQLASLEQVALGLATAGREMNAALTACMADRNSLVGKP